MLLPLIAISAVLMFAQEFELILDGKFTDLSRLPAQDRQAHEFTFVRLIYNGRISAYLKNWYTDYPKGDRQLINVLHRLTGIDVAPQERALPIHHPDIFNYPMLYSAEGGQMVLDKSDSKVLREYLMRGGFWMIDDFWGSTEWSNFELQMQKVFPDRPIVEIPQSHAIFHNFYQIDSKMQVPNIGYAYCGGCPTWEQDGFDARVRGIFDKDGRLLVFINFNTDLMDASEWADDPNYPQRFSAYSYKVFSNAVVYAMSH